MYAEPFVACLQTGLAPAQSLGPAKDNRTDKASKHILAPKKELTVRREDAFITFFPESTQRLTYGIDESREAPIIGKQWFSWAPSEDQHYRWGIAPARTYAPSLQVCLLFSPPVSSFPPNIHTDLHQMHVLDPSKCVLSAVCNFTRGESGRGACLLQMHNMPCQAFGLLLCHQKRGLNPASARAHEL